MALAERWCLITGGSKGIGRSIALELAGERANIVLVARDPGALEATAKECRDRGAAEVEVHALDGSDQKAMDGLADAVISKHGGLHMLVNNAGWAAPGTLEGDPDDWEKMYRLNVLTPMRLTHRFSPGMVEKKDGIIVNIGSVMGLIPSRSMGAYASSKWALKGWSLSIAEALRPHNIKVTLVQPAFVETDATKKISGVDTDKMMPPDDVAKAVMLAVHTSAKCTPEEINLKELPNLLEHYP